jgi:hypothetical protein
MRVYVPLKLRVWVNLRWTNLIETTAKYLHCYIRRMKRIQLVVHKS